MADTTAKINEVKELFRRKNLSPTCLKKFNRDIVDKFLIELQKESEEPAKVDQTAAITAALCPAMEALVTQFSGMFGDMVSTFTDKIERLTSVFMGRMQDLEKENSKLKQNQTMLKEEIEELNQYSRRENLLIHGLAPSQIEKECGSEEYAATLLKECFPQIGLVSSDISIAHRIPAKGNKPGPLIVRFARRSVRNKILLSRRAKRNYEALQSKRISITEHLTPSRQNLLKKARAIAADYRAVCSWSRDGQIFIRDLTYKTRQINKEADLLSFDEVISNKQAVDKYWSDQKKTHQPKVAAIKE